MYVACEKCKLRHNPKYNCVTKFYEHPDGRAMTLAEALNDEITNIKGEQADLMLKEASRYTTETDDNDKRWWDFIYFHYSPSEMTPLFQMSDLMGD